MEKIKDFLTVETGSGFGSGDGDGYGDGSGSGSGYGYGSGDGSGSCSGYGDGYGDGSGSGSGYGDGSGFGGGSGYGFGGGIKTYNGQEVHQIDDVPTIITIVKGNIAKGFILNGDLTLTPCYVAKGRGKFAHGETMRQAVEDLQNKLFEDMDTDEVIALFLKEFPDLEKKYPAKSFYIWHNRLTGSCEMGRNSFVKNGGYDLENDTFTVAEFIDITRNAFGSDIIKRLEKAVKKEEIK